jgi:inositol 2-dehydrogenase
MGRIYAQTVAGLEGVALHAIADPAVRPDDAPLAALNVPHVFDRAEAAMALPTVHAVIIATPTQTHPDLVIAAAQAGKAIFCEKPLALSLEAARKALEVVETTGVPLQVGFMRRFDESYQKAYRAIQAGRLGRPLMFKAVGRDPGCPDPAFADPVMSGGLIVDMAIHDFDLARWLMGREVEHVSAAGSLLVCDALQAVGDIDNAVINLRFEDGALGNIEVSRNASYGYDVRTEVLGTTGRVHVGSDEWDSTRYSIHTARGTRRDHYLTQRFGAAYRAQIHHFVACVREGRPPSVTGRDALAATELARAATFSAHTREPVSVQAVRDGWAPDLATL